MVAGSLFGFNLFLPFAQAMVLKSKKSEAPQHKNELKTETQPELKIPHKAL
jgi:hypothetical protein